MKIAYVTPRHAPFVGGVETHVRRLSALAAAAGHEVQVITQRTDARSPDVELLDGTIVRRFPSLTRSRAYPFSPSLWRYLARHANAYDVVHAHCYHALPALGAALASPRALVFTPHYHGGGHTSFARFLHVLYRPAGLLSFRRAGRIICVSQAEAEHVLRDVPDVATRLDVIPNAVDATRFRAADPFPHTRPIVLSVGRLDVYKQVDRVLDACARLGQEVEVVVVGDGPAKAHLQAHARRLGLTSRFLGRINDDELVRWYRSASVFTTLSCREAFGISMLEALAAGSPVVASAIPAHREVAGYAPGCVTLVASDASSESVASALREALRNPTRPAVSVPTWEAVSADTLALYARLLSLADPDPFAA